MKLANTVLAGLLASYTVPTAAFAGPQGSGKTGSGARPEAPAKKKLPLLTMAQVRAMAAADPEQLLEKLKTGLRISGVDMFRNDRANAVTALLKLVSGIRKGDLSRITLRLKKRNELVIRIGEAPAGRSPMPSTDQPAADPEEDDDELHAPSTLPPERLKEWIDLTSKTNDDRRAARKEQVPFNVEQITTWLAALAKDVAATTDPVQRRVLAGVQFFLETTKRGTRYDFGSNRDYDINTAFDCSEAVQWMMRKAGFGDIFGEGAENIATLYMSGMIEGVYGSGFRARPRIGDLLMWGAWDGNLWKGHTAMVVDVREAERTFRVSHIGTSGSSFNAFSLDDPAEWVKWAGGKTVQGFWAPEDARLPAPIGIATIVNTGLTPYKYFMPNTNANSPLGSEYASGEQVELLKKQDEMWLVRRLGSGGAAWVRAKNIKQAP